jgi:hypothetical protein
VQPTGSTLPAAQQLRQTLGLTCVAAELPVGAEPKDELWDDEDEEVQAERQAPSQRARVRPYVRPSLIDIEPRVTRNPP